MVLPSGDLEHLTKPFVNHAGMSLLAWPRNSFLMICGRRSPADADSDRAAEGQSSAGCSPRCADRHPVCALHGHTVGASAIRGCRLLGYDLLASAARLAGCGSVGQDPPPHARPTKPRRSDQLIAGLRRRLAFPPKRGRRDRPEPDRPRQTGTKRHIMVDRAGIPLAVVLTGANRHDSMALTDVAATCAPAPSRPHRKARGRKQQPPWKAPMGRREDVRMDQPVQATDHPLRTPCRSLSSIPRHRCRNHMLQSSQAVLLGALRTPGILPRLPAEQC